MTTPLVHICNAKSFGPAAAQRLVELHQRQMLVAHGVAQADLGVEIAPLGVQHVDVIGASGTVLQVRQFDVFARRIAQIQLQGRRFAGAAIGDHSVVGLLEDRQDFLLVGQTRFVVGRQRGAGLGGGHDEREQTLNQMLVEMDGFEGNEGIIVIAATNRPDVLDPALLRPGRFDRQVVVGLPDVRGREQILKVHMRRVPLAPDIDAAIIARGTPGFSGADLANLVNEAALFAARGNKRVVSMVEFEKAKDKIMMGAERRSMVMTEAQKESTAYHEAGHAIIGRLVPEHDPVHKVTIIPRGRALGVTFFLPEGDAISASRQKLESQISTLYGGRLAEEIIYGPEHVSTGASNDIKVATNLARNMVTQWGFSEKLGPLLYAEEEGEVFLGRSVAKAKHMSDETARIIDQEVKALIERNYNRARQLLTDNMDILHAMKDALMKYETIDAPQIDDLMARRDVRPPAGWEEPGASNNSGDNGSPKAPRPVDEPRTPNPGNTMSEQLGDK